MSGVGPALALEDTTEHALLRQAVGDIAAAFGPAYMARCTAEQRPPRELWDALGAHGFLSVSLPAEHGGGGLGLLELAIVEEEVSTAGCPLLPILTSPGVVGTILARHGTGEQRERWLPGLGTGVAHYALAVTEPDAGSNSHRVRTQAERSGAGWVLRGTKTYISGIEDAEAVLVLARTGAADERGRGGLSLFIVDTDAPGLRRQVIDTAIQAPDWQWTLFFDGVEVDGDRMLGPPGEGLRLAFDGLNPERILAAALCTGVGRFALDRACEYARTRVVWDRPIGAHQGVAHPLAEAKIALEAARLMTWSAATLHDAGRDAGEASNMAKLLAADAGARCLDQAIQTHGGNGLAREYGLADLWFTVRLMRIAPVSREMILNHVAQHGLGLPRSY